MNFRDMSPEQRRTVSSQGGRTAHQKGTAHQWTTEEARAAGRKGGLAPRTAPRPRRQVAATTNPASQE